LKRSLLVLFFLSLTISIFSININEFFNLSKFHYDFNAYNGGGYYSSRINKEWQYFEKLDLDFGWKFNFQQNFNVWVDLSYNDDLFNKSIVLESTGFSYKISSWELLYMYSRLQYSNRARLLNFNVKNVNYNQPVFIDHRFQGIRVSKDLERFHLTFSGGGNSFNTGLLHSAINYTIDNTELELFLILTGRNEFLNEESYTLGLEYIHLNDLLYLYFSQIYHKLIESSSEKFESLNEIVFYPTKTSFLGTNLIYSIFNWKEERNWKSKTSFGIDIQQISYILSYEYQNSEGDEEHWGNRKINFLTNYNLSPTASIGLDLSYYDPTYDKKYYQIGIQGRIKYETD